MSSELKNKINDYALSLGFCDIGYASAEPLDEEYENYLKWLDKGYNSSMEYMARNLEKRQNVSNILPDARTVIVTAYNYYTGINHDGKGNHGKIARYAWGYDYHNILLPKIKDITVYLNSLIPLAKTWCYVDTGPVLEKAFAVRSGIGWQGKNGLILSRKFGSFIFLGIIITTAEFEPVAKMKDYCGKCTKCIQACPTQAIVEPKIVDSNKCISYWTIEAKPPKNIPYSIQEKQSAWLFGCDICQEVCPWNKNLEEIQTAVEFKPRHNETELELDKVLSFSHQDFTMRFNNSPIKRAKCEGLKENAEALIKNSRE